MKNKIIFYVKADRGIKYGFGHIYRCNHIYEKLKKSYKCHFFVNKNKYIVNYLNKRRLHYSFITKKNSNFVSSIDSNTILIVDIFKKVDKNFLNIINSKPLKKIIFFDNLQKLKSNIIRINPICFTHPKLIYNNDNYYGGLKYFIFPKFFKKKRNSNKNNKTIFFSSGGSDKRNITSKFLEKFFSMSSEYKFNVLVGPGFSNQQIRKLIKINKKIKIFKDVKNISTLINKCELAITTGGIVMFECIALKIPTFAIKNYEHQIYNISYFKKRKCVSYIGSNINKINFKDLLLKIKSEKYLNKIKFNCKRFSSTNGINKVLKLIT